MIILIVMAAVFSFLLLYVLKMGVEQNEKKTELIILYCRVLYQAGYDDHAAGKPEQQLDIYTTISACLEQAYREGYSDAAAGLPSKTEQLIETYKEMSRILSEMKVTLTTGFSRVADSLKGVKGQ